MIVAGPLHSTSVWTVETSRALASRTASPIPEHHVETIKFQSADIQLMVVKRLGETGKPHYLCVFPSNLSLYLCQAEEEDNVQWYFVINVSLCIFLFLTWDWSQIRFNGAERNIFAWKGIEPNWAMVWAKIVRRRALWLMPKPTSIDVNPSWLDIKAFITQYIHLFHCWHALWGVVKINDHLAKGLGLWNRSFLHYSVDD